MNEKMFDEDTESLGFSGEISPEDEMFVGDHVAGAREHYFLVGRSALRSIKVAMLSAGKREAERILDLPCGHGRVLRMLRAAFPHAEITACDILASGVDFCAETFGAIPAYSSPRPQEIRLAQRRFDLIWCGSLLTHLNAEAWDGFLRLFTNLLAPGGLLVFTTHGRLVASRMRSGSGYGLDRASAKALLADYEATGFGFAEYRDRPEHSFQTRVLEQVFALGKNRDRQEDYGISLSSPKWVCDRLARLPELRLIYFNERAWDNHQDVVGCLLPPEHETGRARSS